MASRKGKVSDYIAGIAEDSKNRRKEILMFNVVDENGRPIEENVGLRRAMETIRLNPGSKMTPPTKENKLCQTIKTTKN